MSIRSQIIPSGNCLPGSEHAIDFQRLEEGNKIESHFQVAKAACENCLQLDFCKEQQRDIASYLWQQGLGMVGGDVVSSSVDEALVTTAPAFRFDLREMPSDPKQQLNLLRQAMRAGQLVIGSPPKGVQKVIEDYKNILPYELRQEAIEALGVKEYETALRVIIQMKFQQIDFGENIEIRPRRTVLSRYNPDEFNLEEHKPLVEAFLDDVIKIKDLKLSLPVNKASSFDSKVFEQLIEKYVGPDMTISLFNNIVTRSVRSNPAKALEEFAVRLLNYREENSQRDEKLPESSLRTYARLRKPLPEPVADLEKAVPYLTPALVQKLSARAPGSTHEVINDFIERVDHAMANVELGVEVAKESGEVETIAIPKSDIIEIALNHSHLYMDKIEEYKKAFAYIYGRYGQSADVPVSYMRRLARVYFDQQRCVEEVEKYKERLNLLREQSDGSLTEGFLASCATKGYDSFEKAKREYLAKLYKDRFKAREKRNGLQNLDKWAIGKIVDIYPDDEIEEVCEMVFQLVNKDKLSIVPLNKNLLTKADKELWMVDREKDRHFIAFTDWANKLEPFERIACAHALGIAPLLYGREFSGLILEEVIGQGARSFAASAVKGSSKKRPIVNFDTLCDDLRAYDEYDVGQIEKSSGIEHKRTELLVVIGGSVLQMGEVEGNEEMNLDMSWAEERICNIFPLPQQQSAITKVKMALAKNILAITRDTGKGRRFVFGKAVNVNMLSDTEKAVIAHTFGIDRVIYGKDLTFTIKHRLTQSAIELALRRSLLPYIKHLDSLQNEPAPAKFNESSVAKKDKGQSKDEAFDPLWSLKGECRNHPPELFDFGREAINDENRDQVKKAKKICGGCSVAEICLKEAFKNNEKTGIWGGTTPRERTNILARARKKQQ